MKEFGLIGYPLGHSFSQKYFTKKFEVNNIKAKYSLFALESIDLLRKMITDNENLVGFNVTIPYKQQIIKYLDSLDESASSVGAVNVVKIENRDGIKRLIGYNSDVYGFYTSIKPLLRENNKKALILGTGGASKAVAAMLSKLGITYKFVSRTKSDNQYCYSDLNEEILQEYTVIVNTTPIGMFPNVNDCPLLPYEYITDKHLAYDLVYNPETTLFLSRAKKNGATVKNGLEMLHLQAERSWEIWNK